MNSAYGKLSTRSCNEYDGLPCTFDDGVSPIYLILNLVWKENMIKVEVEDWVRDKDPDVDSNQRYRTSAPNIMYEVRLRLPRKIKLHCKSYVLSKTTELPKMVCKWLREMCSCSCLAILPGPAWVLLSKIYRPYLGAL